MWSKLDDRLLDHRKIVAAGHRLGPNGFLIAMGMYCSGLIWTNKELTNGFVSLAAVQRFSSGKRGLVVAAALVAVGLWEQIEGGFQIHDFFDFNFAADDVRRRREEIHEQRAQAGRRGGQASGRARRANGKAGDHPP